VPAGRPLLLASASPRRAALLGEAGIPFRRLDYPPVDEDAVLAAGLSPDETVRALAACKARAASEVAPDALVLAADTLVFLGERALGKPRDAQEAACMLRSLSGGCHDVRTGIALSGPDGRGGRREAVASARTRVRFRILGAREIEAYVATGEPLDKAGAYGIQAGAAGFVAGLDGDLDTVIGLPVALVRSLLASWPESGPGGGPAGGDPAPETDGR
jgi:septum formation protein